jgi:hypothetical protein
LRAAAGTGTNTGTVWDTGLAGIVSTLAMSSRDDITYTTAAVALVLCSGGTAVIVGTTLSGISSAAATVSWVSYITGIAAGTVGISNARLAARSNTGGMGSG